MHDKNHVVIMAGGIGSRFWPLSSQECPKQFIDVVGCGRTLLQLTADRFQGICPPQNLWVVTSERYADLVREQLPQVPAENILLEPCRRNTAPCIAYAAYKIKARDPRASMVVTPSDHVVMDTEEFRRVMRLSLKFVADSDAILTVGVKPTRPETGYGYIEAVLDTPSLANREIYRVDSFKEKPDVETAERYIRQRNFFWNSGIFIWNVNTITNALKIYQSSLSDLFKFQIFPYMNTAREEQLIRELFPQCESISIDYAVLEKAEEIFVFPANFGWSDLGTWGALYNHLPADLSQNVAVGSDISLYESRGCIVHTMQQKRVVVIGMNDCIIAQNDDALLVCKKSDEQRIKEFTDK